MQEQYQEIHKQAERLYYRFQDKADAPQSDQMQALKRDIRQVMEDIESEKKPRSIEDQVKQVMRQLKELEDNGAELMDSQDADELHDQFEDLRQELKELPNY